MSEKEKEPQVIVFVCGTNKCPEAGEHDDKGYVEFADGAGASVACSKCGSTAFERDMLRLP